MLPKFIVNIDLTKINTSDFIIDRVDKSYDKVLFVVFHCFEAITFKVNAQPFHNIFVLLCCFCLFSATFLYLDVTAFCKSFLCFPFVKQ